MENKMGKEDKKKETEDLVTGALKEVYDPELPVNIFDLGLIYKINVDDNNKVEIVMTLTAPNCPMADELLAEVDEKVKALQGVDVVDVKVVFSPPWDKSMMSDEAKLELGLL